MRVRAEPHVKHRPGANPNGGEMKAATNLRDAIVLVFESEPKKRFTLKEIYENIAHYYELSDQDKELDAKYPQPRYYHEARAIIASLEKQDVIERLDRDQRRLKAKTQM